MHFFGYGFPIQSGMTANPVGNDDWGVERDPDQVGKDYQSTRERRPIHSGMTTVKPGITTVKPGMTTVKPGMTISVIARDDVFTS